MIPAWIKEVWPALACIFAGVVAFLTFAQQLLTIVKLRLEIRDLTARQKPPQAAREQHDHKQVRSQNHSQKVPVGLALKVAFLSFLVAAGALGYVWQKEQVSTLAAMTTARQEHLSLLRKYNALMSWVVANTESNKVSKIEATTPHKQ